MGEDVLSDGITLVKLRTKFSKSDVEDFWQSRKDSLLCQFIYNGLLKFGEIINLQVIDNFSRLEKCLKINERQLLEKASSNSAVLITSKFRIFPVSKSNQSGFIFS